MKKYLITSQDFYSDEPELFRNILYKQIVKNKPDFILYRDKENLKYSEQAIDFIDECRKFKSLKTFIHRDILLAKKLKATGVHLTSKQFEEIPLALSLNLDVIISTHSYKEVFLAQEMGATYVTYSPIFLTPNKGIPKGIEDLKYLLTQTEIKIFALGGIVNEEHLSAIAQTETFGFASIRYFIK